MAKKTLTPLLRIIDANFNRAKEGLRVCEDICRYVWNEKTLTRELKILRHDLSGALKNFGLPGLIESRDIGGDVGRATSVSESRRSKIGDIVYANSQRVKESLRVLEEILKLIDSKSAEKVKTLRYRMYAVEKKLVTKSSAVSDPR